jgi:hypothetical protein
MKKILLWLGIVPLLAGCGHVESRTAPKANLSHYEHVYVKHLLTDGRGMDELIARELRRLGYDASAGPITLMPKNAEVVIVYQDHWNFDFTNYMIGIDLQVMTAYSGKLLADASSFHPSFTGNSPAELVDELLKPWFKPHVPPVPQTPSDTSPEPST